MKLYIGITFFAIGLLLPLLALVVPFLGIPTLAETLLSAILIVGGPEVFLILGVVFAGKPTMTYIKKRFKSAIFDSPVSAMRHYLGIGCLVFSVLSSWIMMYIFVLTNWELSPEVTLILFGSIDLLFVVSFFIMGGPFLQKLMDLFTRESPASTQQR